MVEIALERAHCLGRKTGAATAADDPGRGEGKMLRGLSVVALALALLAAPAEAAEANYPSRSISLVVPFAAGGPTDVVARIVGDHMSRTLGQQLVVENIGGAGGTTGMAKVAAAEPDGYTLGIGNMGTQSAAPALYPNLKYDPATSFAQVGIANFTPQAIVAKKDNPAKDLQEFIAYLKANQAKLSYGHAGVGSISHVSGTLFNTQFGLKPALVAYRGTAPALNDLVGGQIDYMVDQSLNVIPQIKAGTIRVFAVAAAQRLESLPDVPTTKEAGVDFIFSAWNAMVAPKGTPKEIIDKLTAALNKALDDPATVKRYVDLGSTAPEAGERGPACLQRLVESEMARITPVLKDATAK
jgi:tripartite-type tricarboxylate transporter receptor subunit TctC